MNPTGAGEFGSHDLLVAVHHATGAGTMRAHRRCLVATQYLALTFPSGSTRGVDGYPLEGLGVEAKTPARVESSAAMRC